MDTIINQKGYVIADKTLNEMETVTSVPVHFAYDKEKYRQLLKEKIDTRLKESLEGEIQKAAVEIEEEQQRAVNELIGERQTLVKKILDEEKKIMWTRMEELRRVRPQGFTLFFLKLNNNK